MPYNPYTSNTVPYDLCSSSRLTEKQIHELSLLFNSFAIQAGESLTAFCRQTVTATLQKIEQIPFSRYLRSLNQPSYLANLNANPLKMAGFLEVNAQIAYSISSKMLGGTGNISSLPHTTSGLEMAINRKFINLLLRQLSSALKPITEVFFSLDEIYKSPHEARLFPSHELCVVASIFVHIQEVREVMTVLIPAAYLLPLLGPSDPSALTAPGRTPRSANWAKHLEVEMCAHLGQCELTEKEIRELCPGDVIILDHKIDQPIDVDVSDALFCTAKPGLKGSYRAVAIST